MDIRQLITVILENYPLPWFGRHGIRHWARVYENGIRLARMTSANAEVVRLFAVLHDSKRTNEGLDPGHGRRGADFAALLRGKHFELPDPEFALLLEACSLHARGYTKADVTVQTCWDADRLDLLRAGIAPSGEFLCTPAARDPEMISWANARSLEDFAPGFLDAEWLDSSLPSMSR